MRLTFKQIELLTVIAKGNGPNPADPTSPNLGIDLDEILERIRYETTKQSLHFSIRALIKHELIEKLGVEKRRGRQRQVIGATKLGAAMVGVGSSLGPGMVVSEEENAIEELFE